MSSLFSALPKPKYSGEHEALPAHTQARGPRVVGPGQIDETQVVLKRSGPPPYGERSGWRPRNPEDFGNGGAFPEVHVAQYPRGMGSKKNASSNALAVQLDAEGQVKYDAIARQGHAENRIIHTSFKDLIPLRQQANAGQLDLSRPDREQVEATTQKTKQALEKLISGAVAAQKPKNIQSAGARKEATFVRYTPANQMGNAYEGKKQERIIKIVERQQDPMEPARFKHKKIPGRPPSPPPPVMRSPPRKLTAEDQEAWRIPPVVSNWKNPKGFTVPLDKRLAADGRGLQEKVINDKFAQLSESLHMAARHARDEVRERALMQQRLAEKEKAEKEEALRAMAAKAREEAQQQQQQQASRGRTSSSRSPSPYSDSDRSRSRSVRSDDSRRSDSSRSRSRSRSDPRSRSPTRPRRSRRYSDESDGGDVGNDDDDRQIRAREAARRERLKEEERRLRQSRMGMERKIQVMAREQDRDISERVALGLAKPTQSKEGMYDARLFNQSEGLRSGFNEDNPYDKPLFAAQDALTSLYRPRGGGDADADGVGDEEAGGEEEMNRIRKADRFGAALGKGKFQGTAEAAAEGGRTGPVQFERERRQQQQQQQPSGPTGAKAEDPFNVDQFLAEVDQSSSVAAAAGKRGYGLQTSDQGRDDREVKRPRAG